MVTHYYSWLPLPRLHTVMTSGSCHTVEHVGQYEYDKTNILGHGAFAVVYRGINRVVSDVNSKFKLAFLKL